MSRKGFIALPILIFAAAVAVGATFYFSGYFGVVSKKDTTADTTVDTMMAQNADTSTEGWQTYRNEKYGFEVKYPEGWFSQPYYGGEVGTFGFWDSRDAMGNAQPPIFAITLSQNKRVLYSNSSSSLRFDLGGVPALRTEFHDNPQSLFSHMVIFNLDRGGVAMRFDPRLVSSEVENSILSTFRPIDLASLEEANALWSIYRNDEYGFEVQYPETWKVGRDYFTPSDFKSGGGAYQYPPPRSLPAAFMQSGMQMVRISDVSEEFKRFGGDLLSFQVQREINTYQKSIFGDLHVLQKISEEQEVLKAYRSYVLYDYYVRDGDLVLYITNDHRNISQRRFDAIFKTFHWTGVRKPPPLPPNIVSVGDRWLLYRSAEYKFEAELPLCIDVYTADYIELCSRSVDPFRIEFYRDSSANVREKVIEWARTVVSTSSVLVGGEWAEQIFGKAAEVLEADHPTISLDSVSTIIEHGGVTYVFSSKYDGTNPNREKYDHILSTFKFIN